MWTSSSSSPSPSPSNNANNNRSNNNPNINTNTKTMDEVWRDITLASDQYLHNYPPSTSTRSGIILQDFFSRSEGPSAPPSMLSSSPPPPAVLTLSSSALLQPIHHHHQHMILPINSHLLDAFDMNIVNGGGGSDGGGKKRFPNSNWNSTDRRHKRMIKNRESAARSRARKQAYTNELELEVAHLLEENARLKKQQQQLCVDAAAQHQKKKSLHRTSTAPF